MKFTEEQTVQFVLSYKKHPCLYDVTHPHYKNKHAREAAIWDMISELGVKGMTTVEIKKKIKALRSTYILEKDKIQKLKNMGEVYRSRLRWYDVMSSIHAKFTPRRGTNDTSGTTSPSVSEIAPVQEEQELNDSEPISPEMTPDAESHTEEIYSISIIKPSSSHVNVTDPLKIKPEKAETKEDSRPKRTYKVLKRPRDFNKEFRKSNVSDSDNEYDIYGKYVAASLKKLSNEQAIFAQNEINNVLTKAKMYDLEHGRSTTFVMDANEDTDDSVED